MASNNIQQTQLENFRRRGIKTRRSAESSEEFIGRRSGRTFDQVGDDMESRFSSSNTDVAVLGEAYKSGAYGQDGSRDLYYEAVYGYRDWTAAEGNSVINRALASAFGDNDTDPTSESKDLTGEELQRAIGQGVSKTNIRSAREKLRYLLSVQNNISLPSDEDTDGIRGVDDSEVVLEPLA